MLRALCVLSGLCVVSALVWSIGGDRELQLQRKGAKAHRITANWLRERCSSKSCIDHDSQQPLLDPHLVGDVSIEKVIEVDGFEFEDDGMPHGAVTSVDIKNASAPPLNGSKKILRVTFSDDTISDFSMQYLLREIENQGPSPMQGPAIELPATHLWDASLRAPPVYTYKNLERHYLDHMLGHLLSVGIAVLDGVPRTQGFCTEFGARLSTVRETEWGREFNVRSQPDVVNQTDGAAAVKKDLAYTSLAIGLHTDNPYRDPMPDFQLLHQLEGCECADDSYPCATCGTANLFSDAFAVAAKLHQEDPEAFDLLSTINVRWENNGGDGTAMMLVYKPVIELDVNHIGPEGHCDKRVAGAGSARSRATTQREQKAGEADASNIADCILAIRHSTKSGGYTPLLEPSLSNRFFRARRKFSAMLSAPENVITHFLRPGQMMLFDNKRVLHARSTVVSDKPRFLQGCYVNRDGILYRFSKMATQQVPSLDWVALQDLTKEEWVHMGSSYAEQVDMQTMNSLLGLLEAQRGRRLGMPVDLWEHGLQTATRALRGGEGADVVVMSLLHDMTETLVSKNHGSAAAGLLAPYLDPKVTWMLEEHEVFQGFYYLHHFGGDRNMRERFRDSPHYDDLVRWCHLYDQASFDPAYPHLGMDHFLPMLREVFSRQPFWWEPTHPKAAVVTGLSAKGMEL